MLSSDECDFMSQLTTELTDGRQPPVTLKTKLAPTRLPPVRCSDLVSLMSQTHIENENAEACSLPRTFDCPASAYDNDGRLTFSGMFLTAEDCSFENWFAGRTPQMRVWGKQVLDRWREAGYPCLGEPPPNDCELHLLDFALGMIVGVLLANAKTTDSRELP